MKPQLLAIVELARLQYARGWSPISKVIARKRNQHFTRYTFKDSSQIYVYSNGDAAWFYREPDGWTSGLQRWRNWHQCYATRKVGDWCT